jgi:branched-chain amino acid aminotransferase
MEVLVMTHDEALIWYDGAFTPWQAATTHVLTHSLHYGVSAIEGIRAYKTATGNGAVFRLDDHLRRLGESARLFRMTMPYTNEELAAAVVELLRKNKMQQVYIRPIVFYGPEKLGLSPTGAIVHIAVAAWPWEAYLGDAAGEAGIRVKTSSFTRHPNSSSLTRAKIAALYANSILAKMEATDDGYDEALLLDTSGCVAEGTGENVFIVKNGCLFEPEPTAALVGITRDTIVALARESGLEVSQRRLTRDDIYLADEVFLSGTAAEIVPVVELDRRTIGGGRPGAVTTTLRQAYADVVRGRNPQHNDWLTWL